MNFWQHLNQSERPEDLQGLSDSLAEHFSQLLYRGHSVADLLAHFADDFGHLPAQRLRKIAQAHRRWQVWRKRLRQIQQARKDAKLPPLPDGVLEAAPAPDQLDALVRTARLCPAGTVDDDVWPRVLRAGAALWDACMGVARKEGRVVSRARDPEAVEAAAEYDPYVRFDAGLDELAPHQWLALRRGERAGVLELRLDLPEERLMEQLERLRPQLGPAAEAREPRSLLEELVLDDFRPWLLRNLDQQCQTRAINAASESLAGFLRSPPVQAKLLGAAYAFKLNAPAAAVVVDRDGDIVDQRRVKAEPGWAEKALELLRKHEVQQVVLPTSVPAGELMSEFESALSDDLQPIRVRSAALAEARRPLMDPPLRLGTSVASAVVLARRALDPLKEWSNVDPLSIGIAEYQRDLDEQQLRAALTETVELCRLERRRGKRVSMGGAIQRGSAAMARLNPLVKTIVDLRPGMTVHGVVTNISHFGAFVNVGLPQEALVHISELSDEFVSNPNDVVSIGQQVQAHVLAVDPSRGRISLSLKSINRAVVERERGPGRGRRMDAPRRDVNANMSKAEALANLEKLFKK